MSEALGSDLDLGGSGFSFATNAQQLVDDLIESLIIDVKVDIDFAFGLDITPMFDSSATALSDRIPNPFVQINQFQIDGLVGVNEWSSNIQFSDLEFAVTEAKALLSISSSLSSTPTIINNPSQFMQLINPTTTSGDRITFGAGLDVSLPVFLIFGDFGFGAEIEYM